MRKVRKLRLQFEQEPTVREVLDAGLRFFRVSPETVRSFRSGASYKAWMPDLELTFNHERGDNDRNLIDALYPNLPRIDPNSPGPKEIEDTARSSYAFSVRAHWALDRLIFNAEVLDVASLVGVQEGLLRELVSLYYTRRRLMTILQLSPPQEPFEKITEEIRLDEISSQLDALTGGYFVREIQRRLEDA